MKKTLLIFIVSILALLVGHLAYLYSLSPRESYPADTYLKSESNKSALVITAHDDDAISCAGTVSQMTEAGWKIHVVTFYGHWKSEVNPERKLEIRQASNIEGIADLDLFDFAIQTTDTVKEPWMPVPYDQFDRYFKTDSLKVFVSNAIRQYRPSVIFTLDNIIGGYGHPEHVAVSRAVLEVCREMGRATDFPVKLIYQPVYTPSQANSLMDRMAAYDTGKRVYQCNGMPEPNVEVDISSTRRQKKAVMMAYESQKGPIRKVWPYYNWYPGWIYFSIFSKEYFRVLDPRQL